MTLLDALNIYATILNPVLNIGGQVGAYEPNAGPYLQGTGSVPWKPAGLRRDAWDTQAIYQMESGKLLYKRYPSSAGWEWKPSVEDLVATDWMVVL